MRYVKIQANLPDKPEWVDIISKLVQAKGCAVYHNKKFEWVWEWDVKDNFNTVKYNSILRKIAKVFNIPDNNIKVTNSLSKNTWFGIAKQNNMYIKLVLQVSLQNKKSLQLFIRDGTE